MKTGSVVFEFIPKTKDAQFLNYSVIYFNLFLFTHLRKIV